MHIVLSTSELIEELEYEAKESKRKAMVEDHKSNPKNKNNSFGPNGPEQKTEQPKVTNAELAELAGVGRTTTSSQFKDIITPYNNIGA